MKNFLILVLLCFAAYKGASLYDEKKELRALTQTIASLPTSSTDFATALKNKGDIFIMPDMRLCRGCQERIAVLKEVVPLFGSKYTVVYMHGEDSVTFPPPDQDSLGAVLAACKQPNCLYSPKRKKFLGIEEKSFEKTKLTAILREFAR